ncbi:hypothetical protein HMPREF2534_01137 [Bacteroides thetaiotaomicron]|jgi:hypothetical protein|nr:hypothetical protein HMPREF2534_01137 [Bacteroides thetaiotaomicron]
MDEITKGKHGGTRAGQDERKQLLNATALKPRRMSVQFLKR